MGEDFLALYEWKEYKILILSPGFHYDGMDIPYLTFMKTTHLAKDKSLVGSNIHDICPSLTGNLVSN